MTRDEEFMTLALEEAKKAIGEGEVPVGAVLVHGGEVLARGHNLCISLCDPTAHAEMVVLREAARKLNNYRLMGSTVYVTLEPCIMCVGAMVLARIDRLVYGASDPKGGACESLYRICADSRLNHTVEVTGGVLASFASQILSGFFREKRL
ncbi:MAG TPA: tRNA adenosine(34) deaminase TadA [Syntrophales bacterium]|nr:tRNA adenosine(34) deaminase TadA [Syntrophales bacterium]HOL59778.1 tRNA adenosine(34) deaminase TadA [Syntrophales bacterium]HPO35912.1 tRNA adenosine(34) deaminase TadA [Syntrophales bacterium]